MRHAIGVAGLLALVAACSDGVGPTPRGAKVTVLYTDSSGHSGVVRTGSPSTPIPTLDALQFFAPLTQGVVTFNGAKLSIFRFADPELRPIDDRSESGAMFTPGAVSRDGRRLAFASATGSATGSSVFLHTVDLENGARDSINLSTQQEMIATIAPQVILSVPIWSPSGDSVAFLLPNVLGMQMMLYERPSKRLEKKIIQISSSTYFQVQQGRPHWHNDGTIRLLTRRMENEPFHVLDTLVVLKIFARETMPHFERVSHAIAPDSMSMGSIWSYSFSGDGKSVAFGMSTEGRAAIMVMHERVPMLETLHFGTGVRPRNVLLIP